MCFFPIYCKLIGTDLGSAMWSKGCNKVKMPEVKRFDTNSPKPVSSKGLALGNVNASLSPRHRESGVSILWGLWYKCTLSSGVRQDNGVAVTGLEDPWFCLFYTSVMNFTLNREVGLGLLWPMICTISGQE